MVSLTSPSLPPSLPHSLPSPDSLAVLCKLEALLSLYGTEDLMVVSIHSPKYDEEEEKATVDAALRRVEVSPPSLPSAPPAILCSKT